MITGPKKEEDKGEEKQPRDETKNRRNKGTGPLKKEKIGEKR